MYKVVLLTNQYGILRIMDESGSNLDYKYKVYIRSKYYITKEQTQVIVFIVSLHYYRDLWARQSHLLQSLTTITSNKVNFKWMEIEKKHFRTSNTY